MPKLKKREKHIRRSIALSLAIAALTTGAAGLSLLSGLDISLRDRLFQNPGDMSPDIYVIGVDGTDIDELGPFVEWSRSGIAAVIETLNADSANAPAVIGVDVMFFSEGDAEADAALAAACAAGGNVVVASQAAFDERITYSLGRYRTLGYEAQGVTYPYAALSDVCAIGHANTRLDDDGVVRNALYDIALPDGTASESFARVCAQKYAHRTGAQFYEPQLSGTGTFPIRYMAEPGDYFGASISDILSGDVPGDWFAGCIVLIGAYTAGMQDAYATAIDPGTLMNGVEIHANIVDSLLSGRQFTVAPLWAQLVFTFVLVFAAAYISFAEGALKGGLAFAAGLAIYAAALLFAINGGLLCTIPYIPLGLILAYAVSIVTGYLEERRRRAAVTGIFKQYVAPEVVDGILKRGEGEEVMARERRDIAVMFTDVRSFTSLSESLSPERIVDMLGRYLTHITQVSFKNGGTIDKFIGDGSMVLFNAPLDQEDYEYRAVLTAVEIMEATAPLSAQLREECGRDVLLGIGINCGSAVVGSIGTEFRMDYTAIGDTVNTAARLESKAAAGQILISPELRARLGERIKTESVGRLALKGKAEPMECFSVVWIER